jgi:endonuclease/exonuclease/phosphatase family metal-dependent hydrolase
MAMPQGRQVLLSVIVVALVGLLAWGVWRCLQEHRQKAEAAQSAAAVGTNATVRIATWNLEQFSRNRKALVVDKMAQVIKSSHFDVLACQEIKAEGSRVDELLNDLGPPWHATNLSPETGNGERFVFLFDSSHVIDEGRSRPIDVSAGVFDRHPYQATFKRGDFEFTLITCHLFYGKSVASHARRAAEMKALADYAGHLSSVDPVKDVIVLGDFNEQRARPNLHYFTEMGWQPLITDQTNLGSTELAETLDNIVLNPRQTTRWTRASGSIHYDETMFNGDGRLAKEQVSDHRPAWADFYVARAGRP